MKRIVIAGVSALVLAGTVTGCSSSHSASAAPVAANAPDPCKLVDAATVASIAHLAADSTGTDTSSTDPGGEGRECTWGDPQGADNVVVDTVAMSKADFDSTRSGVEGALGYKDTNVPGLGEEAYIDPHNPGTIDFYESGVWYEVGVEHDADAGAALAAQALALAKALAAKV